MSIIYNEKNKVFSLNTAHTTYQMQIDKYGVLQHLYYGGKIDGDAGHIICYSNRGMGASIPDTGEYREYVLDSLPREYPGIGTGDFRSSAIIVRNSDGSESVDLRYVRHSIMKGKYNLDRLPAVYASNEEAETLILLLEDAVTKVQVELLYGVLEENDIITRSVKIMNQGTAPVSVKKAASACLDFLYGTYDLISFYGTPAMERQMQRQEIAHGSYSIGSRRGVSSHQYNPAVILAEQGATEDSGNCYGMMFVYSGNFQFEAEKDQHGQTRAIMGLQTERFEYTLKQGETFLVPETVLSFSEQGLSKLSQNYHHCIMHHICRGKYVHGTRPLLINSWEASYFDFTGETIYQLAKDAKELGIDMVVLDDGWFGYRNDDNTSLGDWYVNEEKLGCTLGELIQRINQIGIEFGIWFEPEMISEDSDLYREHPEYVLRIPGRNPARSRNQLVLDFSRKEVRDHIFEQMCKVLDQGNIEYLKWDMNRSLEDIYSPDKEMGRVTYDFVLGVYDFLERLQQRYPDLLIEGCASGGGRFDAGMLYYTPQIWCSDNTDALDRTKIQYGTSFFYPIATMGAHVSAVPNHQTGRTTSLHTRGVVAMGGTFGYELNPGLLSDEEKAEIKEQVRVFKDYATLVRDGAYYRLSNPHQDAFTAWQFVSEDKSETLLSVVMNEVHGSKNLYYVRLKGLQPEAQYYNEETNICYYGSTLMKAGIVLPVMKGNEPAYQLHLRKSNSFMSK